MITVENLTKKFETVTAVENISFNIDNSEIFGFLPWALMEQEGPPP